MKGFIATLIATGVALWVAARLVPGISIPSSAFAQMPDELVTFGMIAAVFGVANGLIGPLARAFSLPLNLLTMGLFGFVVNVLLFLGAAYVSNALGGAIRVGDYPPDLLTQATIVAAALGSIVVGLVSALVRLVVPD
ncbi:MAG: phage holin family protein [Chloroflexi bacterium]|nr:phage holin family protein [Chloroflexota bacterium]